MRPLPPVTANGKGVLVTRSLAVGERSEVSPPWSGSASTAPRRNLVMRDPEVPANPKRRQFTVQYKLSIVEQADACTEYGEVAALLRREGLYDSHLANWRKQRALGTLATRTSQKRGRPPQPANPLATRVAELERQNARLQKKLHKAELLIDVQKKISALLGIAQPTESLSEDD